MEITLKLTSDPMLDVCDNEKKFNKKMSKAYDQLLRNIEDAANAKEDHDGLDSLEIYVICAQTIQDTFGQINPFLLSAIDGLHEAMINLLEATEAAMNNDTDFLSDPAIAKKWMA